MSTGLNVGIIVNPKHRRTTRAYSHLVRTLKSTGLMYRSISTTPVHEGAQQAAKLVEWGANVVFVLGGDGTMRSSAPVLAAAGVPVAVVPTGTANVLTRHLGIKSPAHAVEVCVQMLGTGARRPREFDVPVNEVEFLDANGQWHRSHFLSLAGVGGDARTVGEHGNAPGLLGYMYGGARALFAPLFTAKIGTGCETSSDAHNDSAAQNSLGAPTRVWAVMASKVARPAGPIPVFPTAVLDDDAFEILAVAPMSETVGGRLSEWAHIANAYLRGRPAHNPSLHYWSGLAATVRLAQPVPAHLDGDPIGECLELKVRTGELRLRVLAPTARGAEEPASDLSDRGAGELFEG